MMTLRPLDKSGYDWIREWAEGRIGELHASLETPGMDADSTNLFRGQIQDIRRLLEDSKRAAGMARG